MDNGKVYLNETEEYVFKMGYNKCREEIMTILKQDEFQTNPCYLYEELKRKGEQYVS